MYAIVDIETTGGHAAANGITEVAIVLHDGVSIVEVFETLINPQQPIPFFIQKLTGISNDMVSSAPSFAEVAPEIFRRLQGNVFVAHNVNFDYSFVKHQLQQCGYELNSKKLCTIRAARKIIPGLPAYGLSKITNTLGIAHHQKHRAASDAVATAHLLTRLIESDSKQQIATMLYGKNKEQYLPPNVPTDEVSTLPTAPGVYYFYNKRGQVIYIGKAVNLRKRVQSHFSNNKTGKTKQALLREIKHIGYKTCGTDLIASIVESAEIRNKWPAYNRSQRGFQPLFGVVAYEDRGGRLRLVIERIRKGTTCLYTCNTLAEGKAMLAKLAVAFQLCPSILKLCKAGQCAHFLESACKNNCCSQDIEKHNECMKQALMWIRGNLPTFALIDQGRHEEERSFVLVKEGSVCGIGFLSNPLESLTIQQLEPHMEPLAGNDYMRNLVYKSAADWPEKLQYFS